MTVLEAAVSGLVGANACDCSGSGSEWTGRCERRLFSILRCGQVFMQTGVDK